MNRYQLMVGAAIAGLVLMGVARWSADRKVPAVGHAEPQDFAAGRVIVEIPYELHHRFEFRNDTDQTLEIVEIKTSCGCTAAEASGKSFAPGRSGWIDATALLHATGPFNTELSVRWSTGETTHYSIGAFAQVARMLSLSTVRLDLDVNEPRSILLTYMDQDGTPPGPIQVDASGALGVKVGEWKHIIHANAEYGIAAQYSAPVELNLNMSIDEVEHISFALATSPQVQPALLAIRTPALVKAYALHHEQRRPSTGPVTIAHEPAEPSDPSTESSALSPEPPAGH